MANKLKTKCPHCQTKFNISEGHLDKAKGLVRCGACLKIFDASKHISIDAQLAKSNATKLRESRFDNVEIEENPKVKFKRESQQDFSRKLPTEKTKDKISDAPAGPRLDDDGKPTFPHMGETQLKSSSTSAPEVQKQPKTPKQTETPNQTEAPKQPELEKNAEPAPSQFKTPQKSQSSSAKSSLKKGSADDWVMDLIHEFEQDRHSQGTTTEGDAADSAPSSSDTKEAQPNQNSASPLSISAANEPSEPELESEPKSVEPQTQKPSSDDEKRPKEPETTTASKAKKPIQIIAANELEEPEERFDDDSELSSLQSSDSADPTPSTESETKAEEEATSQSPELTTEPESPALEIIDDEEQVAGQPSEKLDLEEQKLSTKKVEHFIAEEPSSDEISEAKAMLEEARTEALINDLQRPMEMDTESSDQPVAGHDHTKPEATSPEQQEAQEQQTPEQIATADITPDNAPNNDEAPANAHDSNDSIDSDTSIESANTGEYQQQEFALQEEHALEEGSVEEASLLGDDKNFPTKWVALSALAVVLLPLLYLVFNFNGLANHPDYRPMMAKICSIGVCELPPYQNISAIHMKGVVISPSPDRPELLNFGAIITNQAGLDQPFPAIQMVFTDRHNRIVQTLVMQPEQYLTGELTQLEQLPSRTPVQIQTSFPYNAVLYSYQVSLVPATTP